jgi:hypothetical protein
VKTLLKRLLNDVLQSLIGAYTSWGALLGPFRRGFGGQISESIKIGRLGPSNMTSLTKSQEQNILHINTSSVVLQ